MTKLEIFNMALDLIHMDPVAAITAKNDIAMKCARQYETCAYYVLTQHPFRESIAFETVVDEATDSYTGHNTLNAVAASYFSTIGTIDADTPRTGTLKITYSGVLYDEADYASWSGTTFTLDTGVTLARTYDNGDTLTVIPNNHDTEWERVYDIPSDSLKILDLNNNENEGYLVEGAYIYTNAYDEISGVVIRYIKDIRDEVASVVLYSDQVAEAIAARMAYGMAPPDEKQANRAYFEDKLQEAIWTAGDEAINRGKDHKPLWSETW